MDHWFESGSVNDVTISNNKFLDGTYGGGQFPTIYINPHQKKVLPDEPYERNITIQNNLFKTFNHHLLDANSVGNLIFKNNTIEESNMYINWNERPAISVSNSQNVVVENNTNRRSQPFDVVMDENTKLRSSK
jgi:hypothetical protein